MAPNSLQQRAEQTLLWATLHRLRPFILLYAALLQFYFLLLTLFAQ